MVCKRFSSPRYLGAFCDFRSSRGAKVYEIFWTKAGRVVKNVKSAKMYGNASPILVLLHRNYRWKSQEKPWYEAGLLFHLPVRP